MSIIENHIFTFLKLLIGHREWIVNNLSYGVKGKVDRSNVNGSKDQIMRIDYLCENGDFYVHTIHEIEIKDGDYLCIYHHAYDGVGFYVEKIGTLEECKKSNARLYS